jgi:tetratricopeptide (TPR) repeat protein
MRRAGRKPTERLDVVLASDCAQREGARAVLAASIARVGTGYTLTANLIDPSTQEIVTGSTVSASAKDDVLEALDDLATSVRRQLGESMSAISQQRTPILQATSSSLDALRLFSQGRKMVGNGENEGFKLIEEAVRLDPDFALAHAALGHRGYLSGNPRAGEPHFLKALSLVDRLTVRERLWIQALADDARGNREAAVESYRAYLSAYPDDADVWFRLGWTLMATLHQPAQAAEAFQRVLKLNPAASGARVNLATCYRALRRDEESLLEYRKAFELRPQLLDERFVNHEFGFALVRAGEIEEATRTFERLTSHTDTSLNASGLRSIALLAMYRGQYSAALEHLGSAVVLNRNAKASLTEMRNRLFCVTAARMLGQTRRVAAELSEVDRLIAQNAFEPGMLSVAATTHVRLGDLRRARLIRQRMTSAIADPLAFSAVNRSTRQDDAFANVVDGQLALAEGRAAEAIVLLQTALRVNDDIGAAEPLARAFLAAGRVEEASQTFEELLKRAPLGGEEQEPWLLAHLELARLHEAAGRRDAARTLYEKFLAMWKDANPGLPPLTQARTRLAALQ